MPLTDTLGYPLNSWCQIPWVEYTHFSCIHFTPPTMSPTLLTNSDRIVCLMYLHCFSTKLKLSLISQIDFSSKLPLFSNCSNVSTTRYHIELKRRFLYSLCNSWDSWAERKTITEGMVFPWTVDAIICGQWSRVEKHKNISFHVKNIFRVCLGPWSWMNLGNNAGFWSQLSVFNDHLRTNLHQIYRPHQRFKNYRKLFSTMHLI